MDTIAPKPLALPSDYYTGNPNYRDVTYDKSGNVTSFNRIQGNVDAAKPLSTSPQSPTPIKMTAPVVTANAAQEDYNKKFENFQKLSADIQRQSDAIARSQAEQKAWLAQAEMDKAKLNLDQQGIDIKKAEVDAKNRALGLASDVPQPSPTGQPQGIVDRTGQATAQPLSATQTQSAAQTNINNANTQLSDAQKAIQDERRAAYDDFSRKVSQIMSGTFPLSATELALVNSVQNSLERQKQSITGALSLEAARSGQEYTAGQVASNIASKVMDLDNAAAGTMASLKLAFQNNNYQMINSLYDKQTKYLDEKAAAIQELHDNVVAEEKLTRDSEIAAQKELKTSKDALILEAAKNGAPKEIIDAIAASNNVSDAIALSGDYIQTGTGIMGEYLFYKRDAMSRGLKPMSFNDFQDLDANRKKSITNVPNFSGFTPQQEKVITAVNDKVSKNATYTKTSNMRNFVDNVLTALDQENGLSDIAAINQFQKVIDEGAVTRDQDVKLIQQSQSLKDSLSLKVERLKSGEQLSPTQRNDMKQLMNKLYDAQKKALEKDPFIASQKKTLERAGVPIEETILGELSGLSTSSKGNSRENVDNFVKEFGGTIFKDTGIPWSEAIARLYEVDGATDEDIEAYINAHKQ